MKDIQTISARIDEIETKLAFQEDTIQSLNEVVIRQERELQKLWDANRLLKKQLNEIDSGSGAEADTPPPHY